MRNIDMVRFALNEGNNFIANARRRALYGDSNEVWADNVIFPSIRDSLRRKSNKASFQNFRKKFEDIFSTKFSMDSLINVMKNPENVEKYFIGKNGLLNGVYLYDRSKGGKLVANNDDFIKTLLPGDDNKKIKDAYLSKRDPYATFANMVVFPSIQMSLNRPVNREAVAELKVSFERIFNEEFNMKNLIDVMRNPDDLKRYFIGRNGLLNGIKIYDKGKGGKLVDNNSSFIALINGGGDYESHGILNKIPTGIGSNSTPPEELKKLATPKSPKPIISPLSTNTDYSDEKLNLWASQKGLRDLDSIGTDMVNDFMRRGLYRKYYNIFQWFLNIKEKNIDINGLWHKSWDFVRTYESLEWKYKDYVNQYNQKNFGFNRVRDMDREIYSEPSIDFNDGFGNGKVKFRKGLHTSSGKYDTQVYDYHLQMDPKVNQGMIPKGDELKSDMEDSLIKNEEKYKKACQNMKNIKILLELLQGYQRNETVSRIKDLVRECIKELRITETFQSRKLSHIVKKHGGIRPDNKPNNIGLSDLDDSEIAGVFNTEREAMDAGFEWAIPLNDGKYLAITNSGLYRAFNDRYAPYTKRDKAVRGHDGSEKYISKNPFYRRAFNGLKDRNGRLRNMDNVPDDDMQDKNAHNDFNAYRFAKKYPKDYEKEMDKFYDNNPDERRKSNVHKDGNSYWLKQGRNYDMD